METPYKVKPPIEGDPLWGEILYRVKPLIEGNPLQSEANRGVPLIEGNLM